MKIYNPQLLTITNTITSAAESDAIVFISGANISAIKRDGTVIMTGTAGTDDSAILQAAANVANVNSIYLRNDGVSYIPTATVTFKSYQKIKSDGATIDATAFNDVVFMFGEGNLHGYFRPVIDGLFFLGNPANTLTVAVYVKRTAMPLITNCSCRSMALAVFDGECYGAAVDHCYNYDFPAFSVKTTKTGAATFGANGTEIRNCVFEGGVDTPAGASTLICLSGTIIVTNCWLEACETLLTVNALDAASEGCITVIGGTLAPTVKPGANNPTVANIETSYAPYGIIITGASINSNNPFTLIYSDIHAFIVSDNSIRVSGTGTATPMFDLGGNIATGIVTGNKIEISSTTCQETILKIRNNVYNILFCNNVVHSCVSLSTSFIDASSTAGKYLNFSKIEGNEFWNVTTFTKMATYDSLSRNRFIGAVVFDVATDNVRIQGNDFSSTVTFTNTFSCSPRISDNNVYITEKSGTATVADGTTSIVVNHGLSITPSINNISVTPTNNLGNATKYWISTVTATQFTINVNANPGAATATFVWRI
jgi:hypothetical protein